MKILTGAEIDCNALRANYKAIKNIIPPQTEVLGVVKADAYGHGAPEVAKIAVESGCTMLSVARISEAKQLRDSGILVPILLFGYTDPSFVEYMIDNNIIASVGSFISGHMLNETARLLGKKLKVHIKIDTGMGRIGVKTQKNDIVDETLSISSLKNLEIEGIYTHFANADSLDKTHAYHQFSIYTDVLNQLKQSGFEVKYRHAANSAAIMEMPETHLDLVRPGIIQYGLYPSNEVDRSRLKLKPVLSLKSTIIQIKDAEAGFKVSYGSTYSTTNKTKIAVIPVGYADGYNRLLSSKGHMIVNGQKVPIIGRVCMDLTMVDIGNISNVNEGDTVTLIGTDGNSSVTADDIADLTGTINYEVTCALTTRVKRKYLNL